MAEEINSAEPRKPYFERFEGIFFERVDVQPDNRPTLHVEKSDNLQAPNNNILIAPQHDIHQPEGTQ